MTKQAKKKASKKALKKRAPRRASLATVEAAPQPAGVTLTLPPDLQRMLAAALNLRAAWREVLAATNLE